MGSVIYVSLSMWNSGSQGSNEVEVLSILEGFMIYSPIFHDKLIVKSDFPCCLVGIFLGWGPMKIPVLLQWDQIIVLFCSGGLLPCGLVSYWMADVFAEQGVDRDNSFDAPILQLCLFCCNIWYNSVIPMLCLSVNFNLIYLLLIKNYIPCTFQPPIMF